MLTKYLNTKGGYATFLLALSRSKKHQEEWLNLVSTILGQLNAFQESSMLKVQFTNHLNHLQKRMKSRSKSLPNLIVVKSFKKVVKETTKEIKKKKKDRPKFLVSYLK